MADTRGSLAGLLPDLPQVPVRSRQRRCRGKPVYFEVIGPWKLEAQIQRVYPVAINIRGLGWFLFSPGWLCGLESFLPEGIGEWSGTAEMTVRLALFAAGAYNFGVAPSAPRRVADSTMLAPGSSDALDSLYCGRAFCSSPMASDAWFPGRVSCPENGVIR